MSSRDPLPPSPPSPPGKPPKRATVGSIIPGGWFWLLIIVGAFVLILLSDTLSSSDKVEYGDFKKQLRAGNVKEVKIGSTKITGEFKSSEPLADLKPDDLRRKIIAHDLKFSTLRPTQLQDDPDLIREL